MCNCKVSVQNLHLKLPYCAKSPHQLFPLFSFVHFFFPKLSIISAEIWEMSLLLFRIISQVKNNQLYSWRGRTEVLPPRLSASFLKSTTKTMQHRSLIRRICISLHQSAIVIHSLTNSLKQSEAAANGATQFSVPTSTLGARQRRRPREKNWEKRC